MKKKLPIVEWLPQYNVTTLIQDIIAGITVGLTAIPQGIAYAVVAGLSPEYGLYAGLLGGFVYLFFGSCKDITIGPTAIVSTMTAKYVTEYSSDFAVLAAFLSGLVELAMGVLHLGFILEFISQPVITGFTNAAALQIASSQLKALLGLNGSAGHVFYESIINFFQNITTVQLWDSVLGITTIITLFLLKSLGKGCTRTDGFTKCLKWFISLGRNAIVVILGIIIAYSLKASKGTEPFTLIGDIGSGLPSIRLPPFSTTVGNETYTFTDMIQVLGPQSIVLPLVSILESVAIAKAFAGNRPVDATQEMMAIGLCNIVGSFIRSMPVTGSFTRTAINHASGVQTPAGGIFTGLLILLALSLLTSTFYYIPKATLAGLIITAMFSMMEYTIFIRLWKNSKRELVVLTTTITVSLIVGLEYGIITGILFEAIMLLYGNSRPKRKYARWLYRRQYGYYPYLYPSYFVAGMVGLDTLSRRRKMLLLAHYIAAFHHKVDNNIMSKVDLLVPVRVPWGDEGAVAPRRRPRLLHKPVTRTDPVRLNEKLDVLGTVVRPKLIVDFEQDWTAVLKCPGFDMTVALSD
ncbi:sodium-independent sulfate anion transporter-like [Hyposmocoma kahamanoa]|uniref:sodium-independent sulfate anion transporter-like n=1 Tax=Hyposmocoma kahamanoa TaxID=1477025 RepID=UPI000E6D919C|nr:sodium-independent sulfate anion transporter-like [Hyposmocoma kahamanoa]